MRPRSRIPARPYEPLLFHPAEGLAPLPSARLCELPRPRLLECGMGGGEWLRREAIAHPATAYVGAEMIEDYVVRHVRHVAAQGLGNVWVVFGDVRLFVAEHVFDGAFDRLVIQFPDPWPKKRHQRRRITAPQFAPFLVRALLPESGRLWFRSDHPAMFAASLGSLTEAGLTLLAVHTRRDPARAQTRWEARSLLDGRATLEAEFVRPADWAMPAGHCVSLDPRERRPARLPDFSRIASPADAAPSAPR